MTENEFLEKEYDLEINDLTRVLQSVFMSYGKDEAEQIDYKDLPKTKKSKDKKRKNAILKRLVPAVKEKFLQFPDAYGIIYEQQIENHDKNDEDLTSNKYSVYEVFDIDTQQVFFVGTTNREGWEFEPNARNRDLKFICDHISYDSRTLITNLDRFNAEVYRESRITERINKGDYVLSLQMSNKTQDERMQKEIEAYKSKKSYIFKDEYLKHYFPDLYNREDRFDKVTSDGLSIVSFDNPHNIRQYKSLLSDHGIKVLKSYGKTAVSVIVSYKVFYADYYKYRVDGKNIYTIEDVLEYLERN